MYYLTPEIISHYANLPMGRIDAQTFREKYDDEI